MRFYHILHKNSIGHLLRTSQDYFRPPQSLKKRWAIFMYIFEEYLLSLSYFYLKFGIQILIFSDTAKCWREGCSEGWFWPPPLSHQEVIDAI